MGNSASDSGGPTPCVHAGSYLACHITDTLDASGRGVSVHNGGAGRHWFQSWSSASVHRLRVGDDGSFVFCQDTYTNLSSRSTYRVRHNMIASEGTSSSSSRFLVLARKVELKRERILAMPMRSSGTGGAMQQGTDAEASASVQSWRARTTQEAVCGYEPPMQLVVERFKKCRDLTFCADDVKGGGTAAAPSAAHAAAAGTPPGKRDTGSTGRISLARLAFGEETMPRKRRNTSRLEKTLQTMSRLEALLGFSCHVTVAHDAIVKCMQVPAAREHYLTLTRGASSYDLAALPVLSAQNASGVVGSVEGSALRSYERTVERSDAKSASSPRSAARAMARWGRDGTGTGESDGLDALVEKGGGQGGMDGAFTVSDLDSGNVHVLDARGRDTAFLVKDLDTGVVHALPLEADAKTLAVVMESHAHETKQQCPNPALDQGTGLEEDKTGKALSSLEKAQMSTVVNESASSPTRPQRYPTAQQLLPPPTADGSGKRRSRISKSRSKKSKKGRGSTEAKKKGVRTAANRPADEEDELWGDFSAAPEAEVKLDVDGDPQMQSSAPVEHTGIKRAGKEATADEDALKVDEDEDEDKEDCGIIREKEKEEGQGAGTRVTTANASSPSTHKSLHQEQDDGETGTLDKMSQEDEKEAHDGDVEDEGEDAVGRAGGGKSRLVQPPEPPGAAAAVEKEKVAPSPEVDDESMEGKKDEEEGEEETG